MKLHDLLEDYDHVVNTIRSSPRRATLGQGRENMAYHKTGRPETAYRVSQTNQASSVLMQALSTSPTNPFLPRVRSTRSIDGGVRVATTDRLLPMSTIQTVDEFRRVASQVVGPDIDKFEVDPRVTPTVALRDSKVWLAEMIFWYLEHGEYPYTRYTYVNPQLVEVRSFLHQVMKEAARQGIKAHIDHANVDNLMLRSLGTGYQLVINDPLTSQR